MSETPAPLTKSVSTVRTSCRACLERALRPVLSLGEQVLPRFVEKETTDLPRAPLDLMRCDHCGLLQLGTTVDPDLLFREFWYRSGINHSMQRALNDVVTEGLRWHQEGTWLDIGANDGYLLSRVPISFGKVAVEPALNFKAELEEQADVVISDYFPAKGLPEHTVITSAAMFYDLDRPGEFLDGVRLSLTGNGVWINQLNDSPTMIQQNAFDSICHEHLCYYDIPTLRRLYERHGLEIVGISFNEVNGGSVRTVAAHKGVYGPADLAGLEGVTYEQATAFAARARRWKDVFGELVSNLGPGIWCYGASTKGSVLLQYLDLNRQFVAIADRNPQKHGLTLAGTGLPIVNEDDFRAAKPRYVTALPWAFREEFNRRESETRERGTAMIYPLPNIEVVL